MKRGNTGRYEDASTLGSGTYAAFIPHPLPPNPPLEIDGEIQSLLEQALLTLGGLDAISILLPDTTLFIFMYVRKEALLSSQIEGTQSSLSELLLFELGETPGTISDEIREVSNYVRAIDYGLTQIRSKDGIPLSLRLIRDLHRILLTTGRGSQKEPGEFRRSQNWVGGARPADAVFIPPPPQYILECMGELENFFHDRSTPVSPLLRAAIIHVQFETIHPFLDGNGRLGRLLIPLVLCADKILKDPILYLSLYFKKNRATYYDLLQQVRVDGDWEAWLRFFLIGVRETADAAIETAKRLISLFEKDRARIRQSKGKTGSMLQVHNALERDPIITIPRLSKTTGSTFPTASASLGKLMDMGIVSEVTGRKRSRIFVYKEYIDILNEGTEL